MAVSTTMVGWLSSLVEGQDDVIRSFDPIDRGGTVRRTRSGDYGFFAWRLSRFDCVGLRRRSCRNVAGAKPWTAGTLCGADRHHSLSDRVVHHRFCAVRGDYFATDSALLLGCFAC